MGIVEEDIARVRSMTDFVQVASEHVALRRVGSRWTGLCPFHTEKSASFSVNGELGLYYCFGCGAKGDVITFVREVEHLDFVEAVEKLAARAGVALRYDDQTGGRDHQRRTRIYETLERAISWYHDRLLSGSDSSPARAYLRRERGYDSDLVRRYRIGWAPDGWDQLVRSAGVSSRDLVDAGLASVNESGRFIDFFRGRILFPIFEASGHPVGAGGRILPGGRGPKYKNTAGTTVYDKSQVLYGLNWAKKDVVDRGQVVVCEGYTDVIGLHSAGVGEAVATCGTALADGHVRLLTRFARRIVLAYDADAAGQSAAERLFEWERRFDVDIRVAALPDGADPADLARQDPDALARAVRDARPYLAFRLQRLFDRSDLATVEGRARAAAAALALVGTHPNSLVRDQYLMEVADRCRVAPDRLRQLAEQATTEGGDRLAGSQPPDRPGVGGPDGSRPSGRRPSGPIGGDREAIDGRGDLRPRTGRTRPGPPLGGSEREALGLAVHRPEEVAERLEKVLFFHPLAQAAFEALSEATTLHEAIEAADPQTADLLQRLALEDADSEPDAVMREVVSNAVLRAIRERELEMSGATREQSQAIIADTAWLKLTLEILRQEPRDENAAVEAEQALVVWLVSRDEAVRHPEASDE